MSLSHDLFRNRLAEGIAHLRTTDPVLDALIEQIGDCRLMPSRGASPYEGLVRSVAYQQLQGKAADAILARFIALFAPASFPTPADVLAADPAVLRATGFSTAKVTAIRAIATEAQAGNIPDLAGAQAIEDEVLIARLTAIRGVGVWTVEMMLIFTLGRLDVWPLNDFGVRNGVRAAFGLPEMPSRRQMAELGEPWRPYLSIASWYFWRTAEQQPRTRRQPAGTTTTGNAER